MKPAAEKTARVIGNTFIVARYRTSAQVDRALFGLLTGSSFGCWKCKVEWESNGLEHADLTVFENSEDSRVISKSAECFIVPPSQLLVNIELKALPICSHQMQQ